MDSKRNEPNNDLELVSKNHSVSDREILKVIKEEKKFPIKFSNRVKLSTLIKFYNKYWNGDFTDDDSETD